MSERTASEMRTLAIDIGGTGLKASILDTSGEMTVKRVRVATPDPCTPDILTEALAKLVASLPPYDRVSIGFPGVVRGGLVVTAPHFDRKAWCNYPLQDCLAQRLGKPARLLNDAEVQGLGIVAGNGLEVVLTLARASAPRCSATEALRRTSNWHTIRFATTRPTTTISARPRGER